MIDRAYRVGPLHTLAELFSVSLLTTGCAGTATTDTGQGQRLSQAEDLALGQTEPRAQRRDRPDGSSDADVRAHPRRPFGIRFSRSSERDPEPLTTAAATSAGDAGKAACVGVPLAHALVTDFSEATAPVGGSSNIPFGTPTNLAGGTYAAAAPALTAPALSISSVGGDAALAIRADTGIPTDNANTWTGFGLYFDRCVDASAYDAVSFSVRGDLGNCSLSFSVGFSEDLSVTDSATLGSCTSSSCSPPSSITSWAGPIDRTLVIPFSKITHWGSPLSIVDEHALTGLAWNLTAPLGGSCVADFTIDDVKFVHQGHRGHRRSVPPGHTWLGGVNIATAAFGDNVPGQYGVDYIYASSVDVDPFLADHFNVFRIPFRWGRLQRELKGPLDADEFERLDQLVRYLTDRGASVVLDPHDYARYAGQVVGVDLGASVLADFWSRLAKRYRANPRVLFGLMNEPSEMPTEVWRDDANAAIAAIRKTGARNLVLVPGNCWTGASCWSENWYGTPNATAMLGIVDPMKNFAFEVHEYFDSDGSGDYTTVDPSTGSVCSSRTIASDRLAGFLDWARAYGVRAFLGEFGSSSDPLCMGAMEDLLQTIDDNRDVFLGWTYWAAGPWWGDYNLSVQPNDDGTDKPQMSILKRHLARSR